MIIVSDTSPIRALAYIEKIVVLEKLFVAVVIPPAVVNELSHPARLAAGESPTDLSLSPFIEVRMPVDQASVSELEKEIDRGESEAIVLAKELNCTAILMDEAFGRNIAIRHGLVPIGTAGILLRAKHAGLLAEIRPLLDRLIGELGFFIADSLRRHILDLANE